MLRRTIACLVLVLVIGGLTFTLPDSREAAAVPVSPMVNYGVVGPDAIASWLSTELVPTTMVPLSSETLVFFGFRSDRAGLEERAAAVSNPHSSTFGAYRPVVEVAAAFNATDEMVGTVVGWFADRGVAVTVDATRSFASATVSISLLEELSATTFGSYTVAGAPPASVVVTPATEVTTIVPALASAVDRVYGAVFGVDTSLSSGSRTATRLPTPASSTLPPSGGVTMTEADGGTPWRTGTTTDACPEAASVAYDGRPAGLSPVQLRTAYGIDQLWNQGIRGRGARIAVVDYAGYQHSDLAAWRDCFGLGGTEVNDHVLGELSSDFTQRLETVLDLQAVVSIAPDADRIDWFGVNGEAPTLVGSLIKLIAPAFDVALTGGQAPDVLSISFGVCDLEISRFDPASGVGVSIFDQMVATGVASGTGTYVATGDRGSTGCYPGNYDVSPSFPATSRWVTAVGGTNLTLDAANHIVSSGVWNDTRMANPTPPVDSRFDSTGGGLSVLSARQPWQPRIGAGTQRPVPDVSMFADTYPGFLVYFDGGWILVAGTSLSAPLLASSFALQSSASVARGGPRLGFVSPLLYSIADSHEAAAASVIADVLLGNNDAHGAGVYAATPGYDLATGLGWIRQGELLTYLDRFAPAPDEPVVPVFAG